MRAKTAEEVRDEFLATVHMLAHYWSIQPDKTPREMCDGLAFSILGLLDGVNPGFPPVDVSVINDAAIKADAIEEGENWYEPGMVINGDCHLHELYYKRGK